MLARASLMLIAVTLLGAGAWWWFWASRNWPVGLAGVAALALGVLPLLARQCWIAARANAQEAAGGDATPVASRSEWVSAWWAEALVFLRVFLWRQPFAHHAVPDHLHDAFGSKGRRGVVFVHGFVCNRALWNHWMRALLAQRRAFVAVDLEPVFGSIDDYVSLVDAAVNQVEEATGLPPLVVCHSMGGLATRAWMRAIASNRRRVHHVVTLGTPHHGTALADGPLARLGWPPNGMQMRRHSAWLQELEADETQQDEASGVTSHAPLEAPVETPARRSLFTCYHSNCDNIVFPARTATLAGADNRFVPGLAHIELAFDARIQMEVLREFLQDPAHA